jgi:hypothetical protein
MRRTGAARRRHERADRELAIAELGGAGLLAGKLPPLGEPMSRREMLGVSEALLPVVLSIVAPAPAIAQSRPPIPPTGFNFAPFNGTYTGEGASTTECLRTGCASDLDFAEHHRNERDNRHRNDVDHASGCCDVRRSCRRGDGLSPTSIRVQGNSSGTFSATNDVTFTLNPTGGATATGGAADLFTVVQLGP